MEKKLNLGVIYGSRSCEHEVSIISAVQMMHAADPEKYNIIPIYISTKGLWYTGTPLLDMETYRPFKPEKTGITQVWLDMTPGSGALLKLEQGGKLFHGDKVTCVARVDVFVPVMHGMHGEDGTLQGMLEMANMPYTSAGVGGSAIGMDKILMKEFFLGAGFPTLPGLWFHRQRWEREQEEVLNEIEAALPYPVYVKAACLGSSIGVTRAENREKLIEAMNIGLDFDRRVLVEKGLTKPIELNCSVVGYGEDAEASVLEMPNTNGDMLSFAEKYLTTGASKGMASLKRLVPAPIEPELTKKIQELSVRIFKAMDCKGVVRIDYMFDTPTGELYITEINTIPGSLAFYLWQAGGLSYAKLIDRMVDCALKAHEEKNASNYAYTSDILKGVSFGGKAGGKLGGKLGGKNNA